MSDSQASTEIYEWVGKELGNREIGTANRASSAPQCVRKRWFVNQGVPGEVMQPRSLIVFATGDVIEHVAKYFIAKACVGPDKLYSEIDFGEKGGTFTIQHKEFDIYRQETLEFSIGGVPITCHLDGMGKRNSDGAWEVLEIKSASSYGFDDFVKGECGYLKQLHVQMMSPKAKERGAKSGRFFYMNKNTSAIFDRLYEFDSELAKNIAREYQAAAGSSEPAIPEDPDIGPQAETYRNKPTGRSKLGWVCGYCPYTKKCFPNAEIEFKSGKPTYYVKE